jgi:hypothetical protein
MERVSTYLLWGLVFGAMFAALLPVLIAADVFG